MDLLQKKVNRKYVVDYKPYIGTHWRDAAITKITAERIKSLSQKFTSVPKGFNLHRTVEKIVNARIKPWAMVS